MVYMSENRTDDGFATVYAKLPGIEEMVKPIEKHKRLSWDLMENARELVGVIDHYNLHLYIGTPEKETK